MLHQHSAWRKLSRPTNLKNFTREEFDVGGKFLENLIKEVVDFSISTYTNMIWVWLAHFSVSFTFESKAEDAIPKIACKLTANSSIMTHFIIFSPKFPLGSLGRFPQHLFYHLKGFHVLLLVLLLAPEWYASLFQRLLWF